MKRVVLFIITNLAIVLVLGVVMSLFGVNRILDEQGVGLDLYNLLIFASVFGFAFVFGFAINWARCRFSFGPSFGVNIAKRNCTHNKLKPKQK